MHKNLVQLRAGEDIALTAEDVLLFEPLEMHSLKAITDVDIIIVKLK